MALIASLPAPVSVVMICRCFQHESFARIADMLEVSKSRGSQIQVAALRMVRKRLTSDAKFIF